MIKKIFNRTTGILEVTFEGKVEIDELIDYIISVREDESTPKELKILSEATNGKFATKVKRKDLKQFFDENRKTLESKKKEIIYDAFIVSSAIEMALGMLYRELIKIENYKVNFFSTREAALKWLRNPKY